LNSLGADSGIAWRLPAWTRGLRGGGLPVGFRTTSWHLDFTHVHTFAIPCALSLDDLEAEFVVVVSFADQLAATVYSCPSSGVPTISRLLQIIGLFCKRALYKRRYSAKETYNFKEPTTCSHPIPACRATTSWHSSALFPFAIARARADFDLSSLSTFPMHNDKQVRLLSPPPSSP